MLQLNVKVEGNVRSIHFIASLIGTGKILLDFDCQSAIFFTVFHFEQLHVFILQQLFQLMITYSFSTSPWSWEVLSETSLIKEKLN
jgi:hypothetical protein